MQKFCPIKVPSMCIDTIPASRSMEETTISEIWNSIMQQHCLSVISVPFRLLRPELITYDRAIVIRKNDKNVSGEPFTPLCSHFRLQFVSDFSKKEIDFRSE